MDKMIIEQNSDKKFAGLGRADGVLVLHECWAIRHAPTGKFLAMRWGKSRGFSHDEPSYEFPRLFKSQRHARQALSAWLRGKWKVSYSDSYDGGSVYPVRVHTRVYSEMEIVKFSLIPQQHQEHK